MQIDKSCKTCRYWGYDGKDTHGFCKRYPPQVQLIMMKEKFTGRPTSMQNTYFPITPADGWCGEYEWYKKDEVQ